MTINEWCSVIDVQTMSQKLVEQSKPSCKSQGKDPSAGGGESMIELQERRPGRGEVGGWGYGIWMLWSGEDPVGMFWGALVGGRARNKKRE